MENSAEVTKYRMDRDAEPIQGSTVVIIHPGSYYLRLGRAIDAYPHLITHVIARRSTAKASGGKCDVLVPETKMTAETEKLVEQARLSISDVLKSCLTSEGKRRQSTSPSQLIHLNKGNFPVTVDGYIPLTKVDEKTEFIIGDDVFHVDQNEKFFTHWPIKRGQLNLHHGVGGSVTSVLKDLEDIWSFAIKKYLNIPTNDLKHYRAVLVIPDIYNRRHVKDLVDLLMNKLGFSGCFVQQESVCATFGAGLSYACVVDVGDQKTSISCVEDGISHLNSRIYMNYGGSDITRVFHWLLNKCGFPYGACSPDTRPKDALLLNHLKETNCYVNLDMFGPQRKIFQVKTVSPIKQYSMYVADELLIAPLSFFQPEILYRTGSKITRTYTWGRTFVSEDTNDDEYIIQTQRRGAMKESSDASNQNVDNLSVQMDDIPMGTDDDPIIDLIDPSPNTMNTTNVKEQEKEFEQLLSIDQAIIQSIDRCGSDEMKKKMFSCILITGGGMMFSGISTWLENRLMMQIPLIYRSEQMDIITKPKDMDPRFTAWKGAAVTSLLDSAQELWIRQKEWNKYDARLLRERAPFIW